MLGFGQLGLRAKILVVMGFTTLTALLLASAAFVYHDRDTHRQVALTQLRHEARLLAEYTAPSLEFDDPVSLASVLDAVAANPRVLAVVVRRRDGTVLSERVRPDVAGQVERGPSAGEFEELGDEYLAVGVEVSHGGRRLGHVHMRRDLADVQARTVRFMGIAGGVMAASCLLALAVSVRLRNLVVDPIINLSRLAQDVATREDFTLRAQSGADDEIGQLTGDFNTMLAKLQQRDQALQAAQSELESRVRERTEELRRSREKLLLLVQSTPLAVIDWDREGRVATWNPAAEQIFGWSETEARGRSVDELFPAGKDDAVRVDPFSPEAPNQSLPCRNRQGDTLVCDWFNSRLVDGEGEVMGVASLVLDITTRFRVEMAMRESEARFSTVFRASPIALVIIELPNMRVLDANDSFGELVKRPRIDLLGATMEKLDFWENPDSAGHVFDRVRTTHSIRRVECEVKAGADERRTVLVSAELIQLGEKQCVLLQLTDETERLAMERDRERIQAKLLEASRLAGKAEVASEVLHNVGNVLNGVNVSANLLIQRLRKLETATFSRLTEVLPDEEGELESFFATDPRAKRLPPLLQELARHFTGEQEALLVESESLGKKIEHIRDIVSMQQSLARPGGVLQDLNPVELFEDALQMACGALQRHGITLEKQFAATPAMRGDRHKILQILINFLGNAKRACDDSDRDDKRVIVGLRSEGGRIYFSVTDNGVGIAEENLVKIFTHGFTTKRDGHGFGLHGGALAARQMQGAVQVKSDGPGRGACFTLELPLQPSPTTEARHTAPELELSP